MRLPVGTRCLRQTFAICHLLVQRNITGGGHRKVIAFSCQRIMSGLAPIIETVGLTYHGFLLMKTAFRTESNIESIPREDQLTVSIYRQLTVLPLAVLRSSVNVSKRVVRAGRERLVVRFPLQTSSHSQLVRFGKVNVQHMALRG